jgi:hypothetical protein
MSKRPPELGDPLGKLIYFGNLFPEHATPPVLYSNI